MTIINRLSKATALAAISLSVACGGVPAAQSAQDIASEAAADPKIQIGPWVPNTANTEEPFINIIQAGSVSWTETDEINTQELYDKGVLDPATGLPRTLPKGWMRSGVYFATYPDKTHWAGDWVLEWETEEPDKADLKLQWFPDNQQRRTGRNRVEFTRTQKNDHAAIAITGLKSPLTAVRMFRKENEAALREGKIYNPRFVAEVSKYHVVRTMDLQEVNRAFAITADDAPGMSACCWNNVAWKESPRKTAHPFRGMPLEAVVAIAVEADTMLWHHAPLELGAPKGLYDPAIMSEDGNKVAGGVRTMARENAADILASDEWDRYADKFVAALAARGYPETRTLYTTVSNEVWNSALHYFISTNYAWGLGQGFQDNGHFRHGYGAALARWKLALDGAFERAGRDQKVIYVAEGQAANPSTTPEALGAMKRFLEQHGQTWETHAPDIGVSVASYWGGFPNWRAAGSVDEWRNPTPDFWRRVEERILNGPDTEIASMPWVLARFADHEREAAKFGVKLIGAYEGGSHFEKPGEMPREAFEAWHWGEPGARINKAVNDALAEAYPGIILSNYVLAGPKGGQPWFDGEYGEMTEMKRSWEVYQRP